MFACTVYITDRAIKLETFNNQTNMTDLGSLKLHVSLKAKNGVDFITSATIIWFGIALVWTLSLSAYNKSVLTFILSSLLLPLAFALSKAYRTQWKLKDNPLQPLGLWLNFSQLLYFPFLVFILIKHPDYFLMTYAIITGAHFFPFAWFYEEKGYAVMAGMISVGAMLIGLNVSPERMYLVGIFTGVSLAILAIWIFLSFRVKSKATRRSQHGDLIAG